MDEDQDKVHEDDDEELEPLFDYSRVQPVVHIDNSDSSPVCFRKRCKSVDSPEKVDKVKPPTQVVDLDDDEDDWLAPPKTFAVVEKPAEEDSVLVELRARRQELATLAAQSADDVLRLVEESSKREIHDVIKSEANAAELPPKEKEKLVVCVQDKDGIRQFRLYKDDKFEKLFKLYAEKVKGSLQSLVFTFDGDKVSPSATPNALGLENEDILEVHTKAS